MSGREDWPVWARGARRFIDLGGPANSESRAHQSLNRLVRLWVLVYLAAIFLPACAGVTAAAVSVLAAVLFVPWLLVLCILMVLRSTTRSTR